VGGDAADGIAERLSELGVQTADPAELAARLAGLLRERGVSLGRLWIGADILHPTIGARTVSWSSRRGVEATGFTRVERRDFEHPQWRATPLRVVLRERLPEFRRRLAADYRRGEFALLDSLCDDGLTDYLACAVYFPAGTVVGETAGMVATFASDGPGGFSDREIGLLRGCVQPLALAWRSILLLDALRAVTSTYLGADAAARVLAGRIARGQVETIRAAIWFSDLEGFTSLSDSLPKDHLMAMLNVYAGTVLDTIAASGGQVLKLMGDGVLGIYPLDEHTDACSRALAAAVAGLDSFERLSAARRTAGEPTTRLFIGLHQGEVLYGNIGSADRLDFTVLGPAVNEAARLERMCRTLGRPIVASATFAEACGEAGARLEPVGRFHLRGVARPQELFALAPGTPGAAPAA
jgi:adenylate cyclase